MKYKFIPTGAILDQQTAEAVMDWGAPSDLEKFEPIFEAGDWVKRTKDSWRDMEIGSYSSDRRF